MFDACIEGGRGSGLNLHIVTAQRAPPLEDLRVQREDKRYDAPRIHTEDLYGCSPAFIDSVVNLDLVLSVTSLMEEEYLWRRRDCVFDR